MNRDQIQGSAKSALGRVQEVIGRAFGSKAQESRGFGKQLEGSAQMSLGNANQAMEAAKVGARRASVASKGVHP